MDILFDAQPSNFLKIDTLNVGASDEQMILSLDPEFDDFRDILKILGDPNPVLKSRYINVLRELNLPNSELLWIMPPVARTSLLKSYVEKLKNALRDPRNKVYIKPYIKQKKFLRSLSRPSVYPELSSDIKAQIKNEHTLRRVQEFCKSSKKTVYSMSGTSTGRLTVIDGPNILTLSSISRKAIQPKNKGSKILQIDLTAAEPHLALLVAEKEIPEDIYATIATEVLDDTVTRKDAKLITLSALYGQSANNLAKSLPDSVNAREVIRKTKEYFDVEKIRKHLINNLYNDSLRNVLGRPLNLERDRKDLVISHYLQSSVAECSILLFDDFCERMKNHIIPYYVIHDALIFECTEEASDILLRKKSIDLSLGSWKFQAKITEV
jgi:hypothetical protein